MNIPDTNPIQAMSNSRIWHGSNARRPTESQATVIFKKLLLLKGPVGGWT
jgi:hypothetical protein